MAARRDNKRLIVVPGHPDGPHHLPRPALARRSGEVISLAYNPLLQGIGSDPSFGMGSHVLPVPLAPTLKPSQRYLGHLCSIEVPAAHRLFLMNIYQSIIIGVRNRVDDGELVAYDMDQTNPYWAFPDGNVTFFLRWMPGEPRSLKGPVKLPPPYPVNYSPDIYTKTTNWLGRSTSGYPPLNGGEPPGLPTPTLSVIHGLLFPFFGRSPPSSRELLTQDGPGRLGLYVSVRQTNIARDRGPLPDPLPTPGRPEDAFVRANPGARYTGVAGGLVYGIEPM